MSVDNSPASEEASRMLCGPAVAISSRLRRYIQAPLTPSGFSWQVPLLTSEAGHRPERGIHQRARDAPTAPNSRPGSKWRPSSAAKHTHEIAADPAHRIQVSLWKKQLLEEANQSPVGLDSSNKLNSGGYSYSTRQLSVRCIRLRLCRAFDHV